jgi:hypothetical protein
MSSALSADLNWAGTLEGPSVEFTEQVPGHGCEHYTSHANADDVPISVPADGPDSCSDAAIAPVVNAPHVDHEESVDDKSTPMSAMAAVADGDDGEQDMEVGVQHLDHDEGGSDGLLAMQRPFDPATVEPLLVAAAELPVSLLTDTAVRQHVQNILREAEKSRFPPAEAFALQAQLAKATKWPMPLIAQWAIDAKNNVPGFGILGSIADAARAVQWHFEQRYEHFLWNGGSGYGYTRKKGYYERLTPADLNHQIIECLGHTAFTEREPQRTESIKRLAEAKRDSTFFDDLPPGINLANGFVAWNNERASFDLRTTSRESRSRERLAFSCIPEALCPNFLRGVRKLLPSQAKQEALQEAFGAAIFCLTPSTDKARRIVILAGRRNSGKSTILEILREFFPPYAIASVPPEEWKSEYSRALLEGKRLNIVTELGGGRMLAGEHVKRIASCEPIMGRLPYGQPQTFRSFAYHFFATNELPRVTDKTSAFERRLLVINFHQSLEQNEIEGDFLDRVREELPGILNWASDGAERLIQRGHFVPPPCHHEAIMGMQFGADPVEIFARLGVEPALENHRGITTENLREALKAFADARDIDTDGWNDLTHMRRLAGLLKELHGAERATRDGRPFYRFVRLRTGSP